MSYHNEIVGVAFGHSVAARGSYISKMEHGCIISNEQWRLCIIALTALVSNVSDNMQKYTFIAFS